MATASRSSSASHLGHAGARILGSQPPALEALSGAGGRATPESLFGGGGREPSAPPSVTHQGRLYSEKSCPTLAPYTGPAQNVVSMPNARMHRLKKQPGEAHHNLWSDSMKHLGEEQWPTHAVPLFVFCGRDRPRPGFREGVRFTLREDQYVNFALRLRCGSGDRYMGGSVGLVHSPDRMEALPGTEGQLVTVTDLVVNPDSTVHVEAVGDLGFRVRRAWMPQGLRGVQCAEVDVDQVVPKPGSIVDTCSGEADLEGFARLLRAVPRLEEALSGGGPFTVFVPVGLQGVEELASRPDLEALLRCHVCPERVLSEAFYSGRVLRALDGTPLSVSFLQWPKGIPCVNKVQIEHLDTICSNGVIHCIAAPLTPAPRPLGRRGAAH